MVKFLGAFSAALLGLSELGLLPPLLHLLLSRLLLSILLRYHKDYLLR